MSAEQPEPGIRRWSDEDSLRMTRKGEVADGIRRGLGEIENALFDDLLAGRIDRRTFLRHGIRLGVGLGVLSSFLAPATQSRQLRPD